MHSSVVHPGKAKVLCAGRLGLMVAMIAVVAACANPGPLRQPVKVIEPAAAGLRQDAATFALAGDWQALGDPELARLLALALKDSPSLQLARARVNKALELADLSRANAGLNMGLGVDYNSTHYSANGLFPPPIAGNTWQAGTVQANLSWSPDLFGQHAAEWAAAIGQVRAGRADEAAAALGLRTQISRQYLGLARILALRRVEAKALAQREHIFMLTRERVKAGLDSKVEWIQAEALPPETRGRIEALDEQAVLLRRQIAVLCGQNPDELKGLAPSLEALRLEVPPLQSLGLDLLGRRPDIVAARWRIEAATQDVAQARSQFYPNLSLSAFIGLNAVARHSLGLSQLLDLGSRQMGLGPALRLPLFDSGRLQAQLGVRRIDLDSAILQYNQAVLDASREAGDALASGQSLQRQIHEQAESGRAAEQAHELALYRYQAGLGNYLLVLQAETQLLAQRRLAVDLQARALDIRVQLMKSLGGGWQADSLAPPAVTQAPS